jgi:hypothetical protein
MVAGSHGRRSLTAIVRWKVVLVAEADRSMVMVRDYCLAGDCDPTFLYLHKKPRMRKEGNDDPRSHLPIAAYDAFLSHCTVPSYRSCGIAREGRATLKNSRTKKLSYFCSF